MAKNHSKICRPLYPSHMSSAGTRRFLCESLEHRLLLSACDGSGYRLNGTAGADVFEVDVNLSGHTLIYLNSVQQYFPITDHSAPLFFCGNGGNDTFTVLATVSHSFTIEGGDGNDIINGSAMPDALFGGNGNDVINGAGGNDAIEGNAGLDLLNGGSDNDLLKGGDSADTIYGGNHSDTILGEGGADELYGDGSNDSIEGGLGNDVIDGGLGNDVLLGQDDADYIAGGDGNDLLDGGSHNDTLLGDGGLDSLNGSSANDSLNGGPDADSIDANIGSDTYTVSTGADAITIAGAALTISSGGFSSGSTLTVTSGSATLNADAGPNRYLEVTVSGASAAVSFNATQHIKSLSISNSATATLTSGGNKVLVTESLVVPEVSGVYEGKLNLTNNDMIIQASSGSAANSAASSVIAMIVAARGASLPWGWSGMGVTTSAASAYIGLAASRNLYNGSASTSTFSGESVNVNSVLVKYTYHGDADFSGNIDGADYFRLDSAFLSQSGTGYMNGDFNYSGGVPDSADYDLIDDAFTNQGSPL